MDASKALPNELWLQAFGYLSKADLKALRLTAESHLSAIASSLLFTTAYIAARRGVIDTFTSLTTHPVFRQHVKEIIFDSSYIDPTKLTEHSDDKGEAALISLFRDQEEIQANELQIRLENAFKCLSNVQKVFYADLSRISYLPGDYNDSALGCDYLDGPLIRRLESDLDHGEIDSCCLTAETFAGCPHHDDKFQYRRKFRGLALLLQLLSEYASTTLLELSLGDRTHSCKGGGIPHWFLFLETSINTLHCFSSIFYNLRKFELSISFLNQVETLPVHAPSIQRSNVNGGGLSKLLSLAENLEELKLTGDTKLRITNILATHTWARLRVVYLKDFKASATELEDFLRRHAASLRSMTLDYFHLATGSWLDIGTIVQAIAPELEFILGFVWAQNRIVKIDALLPLSEIDLDVSGPKQGWYIRTKKNDDVEGQTTDDDNDEEGDETDSEEDETSSEELDYSSDDSSPETDEPRRKPDIDLLNTIDPELRSQVERLQKELVGCPVQECLRALGQVKKRYTFSEAKTHGVARSLLMHWFGYTELEATDPEIRATVERLLEHMPFDCDVLECKDAVRSSNGDYARARRFLQQMYGHRQKIFLMP